MAQLIILCEDQDQDSPAEPAEMYGSTSKSVKSHKETNRGESNLVETLTLDNKDMETSPLILPIGEGSKKVFSEDTCIVDCNPTVPLDDGRFCKEDNPLVDQVEVHDLPKTLECFTFDEDVQEDLGPSSGHEDTYLLGQAGAQDCSIIIQDDGIPNEISKPQESSSLLNGEDHFERECPICTEHYDASSHKQSLLHCKHVFCDNCIKTMVATANQVNLGLVTCPICRQKTPMMEWEIRKMQDQMMDNGGICIQQDYIPPEPIVRRPGLCGALEYRFQKRFQSGRLFGFPPCLRHPQRLADRLTRLRRRCRCLYLCALVVLLFSEFFCLLFLFLPIVIFILMIVFGK